MEKTYTNLKTKADKNIEKTDGRHTSINDTGSKQTDSFSHKERKRDRKRERKKWKTGCLCELVEVR